MPRSVSRFPSFLRASACVLLATVVSGSPAAAQAGSPDSLARKVEIRRTSFGVPHILAESLGASGYGLAWVMMEDYREEVPRALLRSNGRWGLAAGPDSLGGDFAGRLSHEYASWTFHRLPRDVRDVYAGFAAGMNDFIRLYADSLPAWVRPEFTPQDVAARDVSVWDGGAVRAFAERRQEARETAIGQGAGEGADADRQARARPPLDGQAPRAADSDLLSRWMAWARVDGEGDPEIGSNAWALAPERTESGNAILLRNPHLSWTAGYYEAHVRVPGELDFYGDFRLGGPFTTIGGFNRRLGWATTNNYPTLEEVYALLRVPGDPGEADAYRFDGGTVPVDRRPVTVEFVRADGSVGTVTRSMPHTPLGPVIYETADTLYVVRAHQLTQYRVGEQWLRMMRADDFDEWTEAMKIRAKVSSNLTYADADGNIHLIWNAATPALPHPPSDDPILARGSADVWQELVPYDELPQFLNPEGGYVQNSNDPPYYTNMREPLDPADFPPSFPEPSLRFRTQNSLELIGTDDVLSLEELVDLKYSMKMILADRVKPDLVEAVRATAPTGEVAEALERVEAWDNRVTRDSRGSSVFELWAARYFETTPEEDQYAVEWSTDEPTSTPRGLGDPRAAADAFVWAVDEAERRFGEWDVTWGEVHRIRAGGLDLPVGGCASALGCFRVLGFTDEEDGKYNVYRGDGWVLAVEFDDPPRAYSVLAYGNSNRPESPYYYDQAELFSQNRMKPVAFTEEAIAADLVRSYRPAAEWRR